MKAGWYQDPDDPELGRWHDGEGFTAHTVRMADHPDEHPPPPVITEEEAEAYRRARRPWWRKPDRAVPVALALLLVVAGVAYLLSTSDNGTTTATVGTTTIATTTTTTLPGFGTGLKVVGTDVAPGRYSSPTGNCSWKRLSVAADSFANAIASDTSSGRAVVQIAPTDKAFSSSGCGPWTTWRAPATPLTTFPDGDWVVGADIAPGTYHSVNGYNCYWERARGFAHDLSEIITTLNNERSGSVTIDSTDVRFTSKGCGTWTKG